MGGTDKRGSVRSRRRVRVRYTQDGNRWHSALTRDVARSGFFVLSLQVWRPGTTLLFEVDLPQRGAVRMRGRVAWAKNLPPALARTMQGGFGVQLVDPPEAWTLYADAIEAGRLGHGAASSGLRAQPALPMAPHTPPK